MLAFRIEPSFPGRLVATGAVAEVMRFFRDLFGCGGLERVESGNPDLDARYEFRSDNPQATRPLITGNFAQALDWLREAWPKELARVALNGGSAFILLPHRTKLSVLPGISVELDYGAHVEPIVADMVSLVATASLVRKALSP